ncbi:MAG: VanZ family protein [bacterium]
MTAIFIMSCYPSPEPARQVPIYFEIKVVHMIEYGILCLLVIFAMSNTTKLSLTQILILSITLTVLYGISDEIHQSFVPSRSARWQDVSANFIGSTIVSLTYAWTINRKSFDKS